MKLRSYIFPKLEVRQHPGKGGLGIFAKDHIEAGELLIIFGGQSLSYQALVQLPQQFRSMSLQIDDNLYLVSLEIDPADRVNHSCDPNAGMGSENTLVAIKAIVAGEEVCFDYAMTDGSPYDEFDCTCGSSQCRGRITGDDWLRPELWRRYENYFSPYLYQRIRKLQYSHLIQSNGH